MYETILTCPKCGTETRLVADNVVAERDALREALEVIAYGGAEETVTEEQLRQIARDALESNPE